MLFVFCVFSANSKARNLQQKEQAGGYAGIYIEYFNFIEFFNLLNNAKSFEIVENTFQFSR